MNDTVVQPTYAFEGFRLDAQHRVLSRANGEPIPLAPKVFDTLLYFVERPGQLIAKRELLEAIWPHVVVEENNLNQVISALRRVLGETPGSTSLHRDRARSRVPARCSRHQRIAVRRGCGGAGRRRDRRGADAGGEI